MSARPITSSADPFRLEEKASVEDPTEMQRLGAQLPIERAAARFIVSDDPDEHVERIADYIGMGFRHLVFHGPGFDQRRFIELYGRDVLPVCDADSADPAARPTHASGRQPPMHSSFVLDGVRTPFGRHGKALARIRPDDLAAHVVRELVARAPDLDPSAIDDVVFGDANAAGEDNRNVARMAALLAGLPTTVPGTTVNRLCGSSLESVIQASRAVQTGDAAVVVAGGVESMSRAPWVMLKPDKPYDAGHAAMHSTTLGWQMVNSRMDQRWTIALGESAELLAERYEISRADQDAFAARSHRNAAQAWDDGWFADHVVPVPGTDLTRDESIRPETTTQTLAALRPAFRTGGSVTAGNSSPLSDGATALLIGREDAVDGEPLARIAARASVGNDPDVFGIAPVRAAELALERAGRTWSDVDIVELNEAFAAQSLACLRGWPELDPDKVNIHGGAIAIGHPLGASGARVVLTAAKELQRRSSGVAVVAICIGVGQALALVLKR